MAGKIYRSTVIVPSGSSIKIAVHDTVSLPHNERHIRRKLLHCDNGDSVMLDLNEAVMLADGDLLSTDSGQFFCVRAAVELLYEVKGKNTLHLLEFAWHLGNRHLSVEIFPDYIVLLRDHVICAMLKGLGAKVREIEGPFHPLCGAYHSHSHEHD